MCAGARRLSCCCCLWCRWCSRRRRPRPPARLGGLTAFGAAPRSPPVPSGPSGALHAGGAVLLCVAERVVSKHGHAPPPPTGAAAWPSGALHTGGAFAGWWGGPVETGVAFARAGRALTETAIAFAGKKWVYLVCFLVAVAMSVSTLAVQGRAVVMVVSCWSALVGAVVLLVSKSLRCRVLRAKKFALLGMVCVRARQSSPGAREIAQIRRFCAC